MNQSYPRFKLQSLVLALLYRQPEGFDFAGLLNNLQWFFTEEDIKTSLASVLDAEHSRGNLSLDANNWWQLTERCRRQLDEELPDCHRWLKPISSFGGRKGDGQTRIVNAEE